MLYFFMVVHKTACPTHSKSTHRDVLTCKLCIYRNTSIQVEVSSDKVFRVSVFILERSLVPCGKVGFSYLGPRTAVLRTQKFKFHL